MIFYRSESWVVTEEMMKVLEGFNHCVSRRTAEKTSWSVGGEGHTCNPEEENLEVADMCPMKEFV